MLTNALTIKARNYIFSSGTKPIKFLNFYVVKRASLFWKKRNG
jgi:hypothetical protein